MNLLPMVPHCWIFFLLHLLPKLNQRGAPLGLAYCCIFFLILDLNNIIGKWKLSYFVHNWDSPHMNFPYAYKNAWKQRPWDQACRSMPRYSLAKQTWISRGHSKLDGIYASSADLKSPKPLFKKFEHPNAFVVNWMVLGLAYNGHFDDVLLYFRWQRK